MNSFGHYLNRMTVNHFKIIEKLSVGLHSVKMEKLNQVGASLSRGFKSISGKFKGKDEYFLDLFQNIWVFQGCARAKMQYRRLIQLRKSLSQKIFQNRKTK